jgi:hypothetical protein
MDDASEGIHDDQPGIRRGDFANDSRHDGVERAPGDIVGQVEETDRVVDLRRVEERNTADT